MSRNNRKSPFFKYNLINNQKKWVKIYKKNLIIMPQDIDCIYNIYNGQTFIQIKVIKDMIGYRFGEFINTKKKYIYKKSKNKK